jgi:hypothetical protein
MPGRQRLDAIDDGQGQTQSRRMVALAVAEFPRIHDYWLASAPRKRLGQNESEFG